MLELLLAVEARPDVGTITSHVVFLRYRHVGDGGPICVSLEDEHVARGIVKVAGRGDNVVSILKLGDCSSMKGVFPGLELPDHSRLHGFEVERVFSTTAVCTPFAVRSAVAIVEDDDVAVAELLGVMSVVEAAIVRVEGEV